MLGSKSSTTSRNVRGGDVHDDHLYEIFLNFIDDSILCIQP
jgi:hypothetical protein